MAFINNTELPVYLTWWKHLHTKSENEQVNTLVFPSQVIPLPNNAINEYLIDTMEMVTKGRFNPNDHIFSSNISTNGQFWILEV
jgi:hypothetical protein